MSENTRLIPSRVPDRTAELANTGRVDSGLTESDRNVSFERAVSSDRLDRRRPPLFSVPSSHSLVDSTIKSKASDPDFNTYAYWSYYIPIFTWLPKYSPKVSLLGDFLAGISMALFQMPLVMSFATLLAHLPPQAGLYSIVIGAVVYAILGCVPVMVVGALPSTALIFGQTIETIRGESEFSDYSALEVGSAISALVGGILLSSGLLRLGFLDNVLSRALLKGFIAAMGFIMIINELGIELGIEVKSKTTAGKLLYVLGNLKSLHKLSTIISSVTLSIVLIIRHYKMKWVWKYKNLVYVPELLLMVIVSTALSYKYDWKSKGVEIIGGVTSSSSKLIITNPLNVAKLPLYGRSFTTAFLCTILGYFDSATATKALSAQYGYPVSLNKELIALGATNIVNGLFGGLPSFGAFGRSKINLLAGATTPMAGFVMAAVTTVSIIYLLPMLFYLPECVLALTTTIIGITVLQEVPQDLKFFWTIRGWDEMITFGVVFVTTIGWSTSAGVSLGVLIAIVRVIKHSSRLRIQVLGRVPHTNVFRNADEITEELFGNQETVSANSSREQSPDSAHIENIDGVLIVKIAEPLTFTNIEDLKSKLTRFEKFGTLLIHPSQKLTNSKISTLIVDCKGMSRLDTSATQVLYEIVKKYTSSGISVCFTRVPVDQDIRDKLRRSGILELVNNGFDDGLFSVGMGPGFFLSIDSALRAVVGAV